MPNQFDLATEINDLYRRCRLNVKYYGANLDKQRKINLAVETVIAVGTSGAVASASLSSGIGHAAFYFFGIIAAALTASKPAWDLPSKIGRYQSLKSTYALLHARIERIARDVRLNENLTDGNANEYNRIAEDFDAAELGDDAHPERKLLEKMLQEVNAELPTNRLFWPSQPTSPAAV